MVLPFVAALLLTLASLTAVVSTERSVHRLSGRRGWGLTFLLAVGAVVLLLAGPLPGAEAVAAAAMVLMAGIPILATWIHWRQRKGASDGR